MALQDYIKRPVPAQPPAFGPPPPVPIQSVPQTKQAALFNPFGGVVHHDLYPYSPGDSPLWLELFVITEQVDHELAVRMEWLRAVGANLVPDQQFGFRIVPIVDPAGYNGWTSQQQYETERGCLDPYIQNVIEALHELRRRYDAGKIR